MKTQYMFGYVDENKIAHVIDPREENEKKMKPKWKIFWTNTSRKRDYYHLLGIKHEKLQEFT